MLEETVLRQAVNGVCLWRERVVWRQRCSFAWLFSQICFVQLKKNQAEKFQSLQITFCTENPRLYYILAPRHTPEKLETSSNTKTRNLSNSWSLLKFIPIESVMPSNHLIVCHPLLFPPKSFPASVQTRLRFALDCNLMAATAYLTNTGALKVIFSSVTFAPLLHSYRSVLRHLIVD